MNEEKMEAIKLGFPTKIPKKDAAVGYQGFADMTPEEAKAALGHSNALIDQMLMAQAPQAPSEMPKPEEEPQEVTQDTPEDLEEMVKSAVSEAVSGLRNDIKKILEEDDKEDEDEKE